MPARPVIGVLGGMGPGASAEFYRRLVVATPARRDQDHLHVLIDSDPSVPDRTDALIHGGPSPVPTLRQMARRLSDAGADVLVMACNTASAFLPELTDAVPVPIVDWIDVVAAGLCRTCGEGDSVAVLATDGTSATRLYDAALERHGVAVVSVADVQPEVMSIIRDCKAGMPVADLAPRLDRIVTDLTGRGTACVLLACTELSELLPGMTTRPVDAMDLVVAHLMRLVADWKEA